MLDVIQKLGFLFEFVPVPLLRSFPQVKYSAKALLLGCGLCSGSTGICRLCSTTICGLCSSSICGLFSTPHLFYGILHQIQVSFESGHMLYKVGVDVGSKPRGVSN